VNTKQSEIKRFAALQALNDDLHLIGKTIEEEIMLTRRLLDLIMIEFDKEAELAKLFEKQKTSEIEAKERSEQM
jgi:hypothetical protein